MLGDAPQGWEVVSLSECLDDFRNGWTYDTRATDGSLPITRIETIATGNINYDRVGLTKPDERIEAFRLRRDDILFSHINSVEHIAKVAIKRDDKQLYHGMNLMRLRPSSRVVPDFLFARLQSHETRDHFRAACKRAVNQASLNKGEVGSYQFILPPLDEQQRIAEVLRSVDNALMAQDALLLQLETVLKGARERLLDIGRSNWPSRRFGDVARTYAGGTPPRSRGDYYAGHIPWLKSGEVRAKRIQETEEKISAAALKETSARMVKAGSPVIAMYGATAGVVGMLDIDAAINQAVLAVEPHESLDARFCVHVLEASGQRLLQTLQGSGQPNLSKRIIDDFEIGVPPRDTQREIADSLDSLEATLSHHQSALSGLGLLKSRLASDLLSGRVRVPA